MIESFSREMLFAYLDDELDDSTTAKIETQLRESVAFRQELETLRQSRDRGEHSIGAVWRRDRVSCISRGQLDVYLSGVMEQEEHAYVKFHLEIVGCPLCLANVDDIKEKQTDATATKAKRKRFYDASKDKNG